MALFCPGCHPGSVSSYRLVGSLKVSGTTAISPLLAAAPRFRCRQNLQNIARTRRINTTAPPAAPPAMAALLLLGEGATFGVGILADIAVAVDVVVVDCV